MAFNRCNKDFMGYCNGQPEWEVEPTKHTANNVELTSGGTCKLEPRDCGKYSSYAVEQKEIETNATG